MRLLFFMANVSKTRHFDGVLESLAERGHSVVLAVARQRNRPAWLPRHLVQVNRRLIAAGAPGRIEVITCPVRRVDAWSTLAPWLRQARDYLRYFDERYAHADKLEGRSASHTPKDWVELLRRHAWIRRRWRALARLLAAAETAIPTDRLFDLFIAYEQPDVVLVTPLVDYGSYQTDYVKSAHRSGIPVVFAPFSWDNLTNRGLIRIEPDRVLVWNEGQKREAVELHGVTPARAVVTGASRFDAFFAMTPATSRERFCRDLGLDPARALLLYVCSSEFVAPHEVDFVRRWVAELRRSTDPTLRSSAVLIRPHPAHTRPWHGVAFQDSPQVAIWSDKEEMNADQGLYDSLYHARAVIGLNTSAMIEAGILGKAVHTVVTDEFSGGQEHTLHFAHLRAANGGLLHESRGFDEHLSQLSAALGATEGHLERTRAFVQHFVRPRGIGVAVTPLVVEEIESAARIVKRRRRASIWQYPATWGVRVALSCRRAWRAARPSVSYRPEGRAARPSVSHRSEGRAGRPSVTHPSEAKTAKRAPAAGPARVGSRQRDV